MARHVYEHDGVDESFHARMNDRNRKKRRTTPPPEDRRATQLEGSTGHFRPAAQPTNKRNKVDRQDVHSAAAVAPQPMRHQPIPPQPVGWGVPASQFASNNSKEPQSLRGMPTSSLLAPNREFSGIPKNDRSFDPTPGRPWAAAFDRADLFQSALSRETDYYHTAHDTGRRERLAQPASWDIVNERYRNGSSGTQQTALDGPHSRSHSEHLDYAKARVNLASRKDGPSTETGVAQLLTRPELPPPHLRNIEAPSDSKEVQLSRNYALVPRASPTSAPNEDASRPTQLSQSVSRAGQTDQAWAQFLALHSASVPRSELERLQSQSLPGFQGMPAAFNYGMDGTSFATLSYPGSVVNPYQLALIQGAAATEAILQRELAVYGALRSAFDQQESRGPKHVAHEALNAVPPPPPLSQVNFDQTANVFTERDTDWLSEHQLLLRRQIEFFVASKEDIARFTPSRRKELSVGQVGIRCKHCARLPLSRPRPTGSMYFPFTFRAIYQAGQNMASMHFCKHCDEVDPAIKKSFINFQKQEDKRSGQGGKVYWAQQALVAGIYETTRGLRFKPPAMIHQNLGM